MLAARRAVAADLMLVQLITDAAYGEYVGPLGGVPLPMTADHGAMIAAGGVWMVSRDGVDVGVCELEAEAEALVIFSLAVRPDARGGVGRWMLAFAEVRARMAGLGRLRLYTNALMGRNIGIYEQAGFVHVGRREVRAGWWVVDMEKRVQRDARSPGVVGSGVVVVDRDVRG